jgi:pyruvate/2-oxoglutarate dehydrogenase complex dihydrolipoamide dehydrogenase (E3) component
VLVVGGGPAGMQAAVTACERGHEVVLVEKSIELGGLLKFTNTDSLKRDLRKFKDYLVRKTYRSGAKILLDTEITDELIERVRPDDIIVATGSTPIEPTFIKGIDRAKHATEVYFNLEDETGSHIVMIGGGLIGVEAGLHLTNIGKKVTVLEMQDDYAVDAKPAYKIGLMRKVREAGLEIITGAAVKEVADRGVVYEKDGKERTAQGDTVLYAVGMRSNDLPYYDLYNKAPFVAQIGDCRKVGKVDGAIHSGFFAGLDVGTV